MLTLADNELLGLVAVSISQLDGVNTSRQIFYGQSRVDVALYLTQSSLINGLTHSVDHVDVQIHHFVGREVHLYLVAIGGVGVYHKARNVA